MAQAGENPAIPSDLDWVKARLGCSVTHAFRMLSSRIQSDLDVWQQATGSLPFQLDLGDTFLNLSRKKDPKDEDVELWLSVQVQNKKLQCSFGISGPKATGRFTLVPKLNPQGECRFFYEGEKEEMFVWQVSERILGPVLFT